LAQAISSTNPTAPVSTSNGDRTLPTTRSRMGMKRRLASGSASVFVGLARE